ncbi:MAG: DUF1254 domain-containing protein [Gammaproteobacteria bacterium]|nr:DUF1254 domain-containing protein [Gammaproteobacteria bacterium]
MIRISTTKRHLKRRWSTGIRHCLYFVVVFFSPLSVALGLTASEAKQIAEEAYIYAYPMMQNYKTMYFRSVAGQNAEPPRPFNTFSHRTRLLGPEYKAIVGPNNDTLYSTAWLDLRREPLVISVPDVPVARYYSLQFIDAFVYNFAYIGQRTTGSQAGNYLVYGPGQYPTEPPGINKRFYSESNFVFIIGRILVDGKDDIPNVLALQNQFLITPLSEFAGTPSPPSPETISFPEYISEKARSGKFIEYFNFLLSQVNIDPGEKALFERFSRIGIRTRNHPEKLSADILHAIDEGVESALQKIRAETIVIGTQVNGWNTTFKGFGSRQKKSGQFLLRAAAAMLALYGNDREENSGFSRTLDPNGQPLDASRIKYSVTFNKDQLPPTNAFWSLTMYSFPEILLVENNINRYSIGDRSQDLKYNQDGSLTIYLQYESPEPKQRSNWLPTPNGPFTLALRIYLPKESVLNGSWKPPQISELD